MSRKPHTNYIFWICGKIRRRIPAIALKVFLNAFVSVASVFFALTTRSLVNCAIGGDSQGLLRYALLLVVLLSLQISGGIASHYLHINLQEDMERDFKRSILHTILRTDYSAICGHHSGDLIQRMDGDLVAFVNGTDIAGVEFVVGDPPVIPHQHAVFPKKPGIQVEGAF